MASWLTHQSTPWLTGLANQSSNASTPWLTGLAPADSPLCGGVLSGKYAASAQKPSTTPKRSRRLGLVKGYENSFLTSKAPAAVQSYVAVARKHGLTPAQLAIALCNSRQFVASTVIGATSLEQLAENLEGFRVEWTAEMEADVLSVYNRIPDPWRVQVAGMG